MFKVLVGILIFGILILSGCTDEKSVATTLSVGELTADIDNISFEDTLIGTLSEPHLITISNKTDVDIPNITLNLSDDFVRDIDNTTCSGGSMRFAPGESCVLAVKFTPSRRDSITGTLSSRTTDVSKRLAKFSGLGRNSLPLSINGDNISFWKVVAQGNKNRYILIKNDIDDGKGNWQDIYLSFNEPISDNSTVIFELDNSSSTCVSGMVLPYTTSCIIAITAYANDNMSGEQTGSFTVSTDSRVYQYNLKANAITGYTANIKNYPKSRVSSGIAVADNKLYTYGGIEGDNSSSSSLWRYDLGGNRVDGFIDGSWELINNSSSNIPISRAKTILLGDVIHIIGGALGDNQTNDNLISVDTRGGLISSIPSSYKATDFAVASVSTGEVYLFGGYDNGTYPDIESAIKPFLYTLAVDGTVTQIPDPVLIDPDDPTIITPLPRPTKRIGASMRAVMVGGDEYLYLFGGTTYIGDTPTYNNELWRYNLNTLLWEELTTTGLTARANFNMESVANKIYIYGGDNGVETFYDFYELEPVAGEHTFVRQDGFLEFGGKTIMLKDVATTATDTDIYFYGGVDNLTALPNENIYVYNIADKTLLSSTLQIPYQLSNHAVGSYVDNEGVHVYAIGGYDKFRKRDKRYFFEYDIVTGLYYDLIKTDPPVSYNDSGGTDNGTFTQLGSYMFFINADIVNSGITRFNPKNNEWSTHTHLAEGTDTALGRHSHSAVHYKFRNDERLYIFGGIVNGEYNNSMDIITLDKDDRLKAIKSKLLSDEYPEQRANHSMVQVGNDIYLFGGNNATTVFDDLWVFKVYPNGDGVWEKLGNFPSIARTKHKLMINSKKDTFYIIGGVDSSFADIGDIKAINFDITSPTLAPDPIIDGSVLTFKGRVYFDDVDGVAIEFNSSRFTSISF